MFVSLHNTCRVPRMMLNTRPIGLVFKQHPRDPANVNAGKNMCDPYIYTLLLKKPDTFYLLQTRKLLVIELD